ncbi:MAG: Dabb family protein [Mariniphaga sp.]
MKIKSLLVSFLFISLFLSVSQLQAQTGKTLRHVVMFKFKDTATPANIKTVEDAFAQLPKKITTIKSYEWGINSSPEGLNQGLTHCFLLTFSSDKDRNDYLVHPAHKEFGKILGPFLDKVTVVDFWVK